MEKDESTNYAGEVSVVVVVVVVAVVAVVVFVVATAVPLTKFQCNKTFSSLLTLLQNKLECLCQTSLCLLI
jgi:hypothetical protein